MKKISLITLQYVNNYGSVLQTYASQEYLKAKGYSVEIVNYTRENCRFNNLKKSMKQYYRQKGGLFALPIVSQLLTMRWKRLHKKRNEIFEQFRSKNINLSQEYESSVELMENPPIADYYCVGSDQVWNYFYNDGVLPEYFLQYALKDKKKFALASSIGVEQIEDIQKGELIKKYLSDFSLITVREKSAKTVLEQLGCERVYQILDPTLLLNRNDWVTKCNLNENRKDSYVLLYQLNPCKEMIQLAREVAEKKGCRLIVIANNLRMSIPKAKIIDNPSIEQFLSLILNAKYVVTDSFHGTAFSINFNKQLFVWLPSKYSTRLTSMLELVGLSDRILKDCDDRWKAMKEIDYTEINNTLQKYRDQAEQLIMGVLLDNGK